jgi:hypothetical protein
MNTNPIEEYILESERNLRIATEVDAAWREARKHLVSEFLEKLKIQLKKKLKGWEFEKDEDIYIKSYSGISIYKQSWKGQYYLTLLWDKYGEEMAFGLSRDRQLIRKRLHNDLLNAVRKDFSNASASKWWEARVTMNSPASDWRKPEVLWRMHTDAEFLRDVEAQLLGVAKACESIVDRLVRKK